MGEKNIHLASDPQELRVFMQHVLDDLGTLEEMFAGDLFELEVTRIGAEQELFLVDAARRPAPRAMELLERLDDPRFTTELALFNLEFNLEPIAIGADCLRQLESGLDGALESVRRVAAELDTDVVLTGILPTLEKEDLSDANMTPLARYHVLAEAMRRHRGGDFEIFLRGQDELDTRHDSVMLEACNTSFQIHFQVHPSRFATVYNVAQAVTAPVLAAAVGSPLLFGRRLWRETRIGLFEQSIDTRGPHSHRRRVPSRVSFGDRWLDASVLEIFRDDVANFRLLLSREVDEDSRAVLAAGEVPRLRALTLFNGTVYHWNRPCYGLSDGRPHLRIENRVLPAGPSVIDEVANAALWFGALHALADELGDTLPARLPFEAAHENFLGAARMGLQAELRWLEGRTLPARELLVAELLPRARQGLRDMGIAAEDADHYLDVVAERVAERRTGAQWMLDSLAAMGGQGSLEERLAGLTAAQIERQREGKPVAHWPLAHIEESGRREHHHARVGALMSSELFTVGADDVIDLVAAVMDWRHIRHVPVEGPEHRLLGLVTHRGVLRAMARRPAPEGRPQPIAVGEVMETDVVTVSPSTSTLDAIALMRRHRVSALPVVEGDKLVGIVTERDFMPVAARLLEELLGRDGG